MFLWLWLVLLRFCYSALPVVGIGINIVGEMLASAIKVPLFLDTMQHVIWITWKRN